MTTKKPRLKLCVFFSFFWFYFRISVKSWTELVYIDSVKFIFLQRRSRYNCYFKNVSRAGGNDNMFYACSRETISIYVFVFPDAHNPQTHIYSLALWHRHSDTMHLNLPLLFICLFGTGKKSLQLFLLTPSNELHVVTSCKKRLNWWLINNLTMVHYSLTRGDLLPGCYS